MRKYITQEEAEVKATPWQLIRLRLHHLELIVIADKDGPSVWLARNKVYEAIQKYAQSLKNGQP